MAALIPAAAAVCSAPCIAAATSMLGGAAMSTAGPLLAMGAGAALVYKRMTGGDETQGKGKDAGADEAGVEHQVV